MDPFEMLLNELHALNEDNMQWIQFCNMAMYALQEFLMPYISSPMMGEERSGTVMVRNALQNPTVCYTLFRMYPDVLVMFGNRLMQDHRLEPTIDVGIMEQVGMFIFILAHGVGQRLTGAIFGVTEFTVNKHFHRVLTAVTSLGNELIRPHTQYLQGVGYHRPLNLRHQAFRDCIGVIDGTHVRCVPPKSTSRAFYGRKSIPTQNILAICDFNLCFTFVSPGWEGSMHDSAVLRGAWAKYGDTFPHPGNEKFYLVDQGYAHMPGYMGPYRGGDVRYHFQEFQSAFTRVARQPRSIKEAFNYMHSSCRNVIERTFGVWKARFNVLHRMPLYKMRRQVDIVFATMAVHNFLQLYQQNDAAFVAVCQDDYTPMENNDEEEENLETHTSTSRQTARDAWEARRAAITAEVVGGM